MTRRGVFLQVAGVILMLFVPVFAVQAPRLEAPAEADGREAIAALEVAVDEIGFPAAWLGAEWLRFLRGAIYRWQRAETPAGRAHQRTRIDEAIAGLRRVYWIRAANWALLGLATLLTGARLVRGKGTWMAPAILLLWLGGSPLPRQLWPALPDESDAILLAGLLPMLVALTVLGQRGVQGLATLARHHRKIGLPLITCLVLLLVGGGLVLTLEDGDLDSSTLVVAVAGTLMTAVIGGLASLWRR